MRSVTQPHLILSTTVLVSLFMLRHSVLSRRLYAQTGRHQKLRARQLLTLAIETSCDDTAVAILETGAQESAAGPDGDNHGAQQGCGSAKLWFNEKITADNANYGGIHPLVALESHQRNLATLVRKALGTSKQNQWLPDLVAVTRGPGMRSNLATGIDFAKGLSVAWNVPIIGVHHMQAHLLTPRMVSALASKSEVSRAEQPDFPSLSLLVSGGHTMLLSSSSLTEHALLAESDLPLGQALDKIARLVVPQDLLAAADSTMYGAVLEKFAFPGAFPINYIYSPPLDRASAYYRRLKATDDDAWPWSIGPPLAEADGGAKRQSMEYSFAGVASAVERIIKYDQSPGSPLRSPRTEDVSSDERRALAKEAMRVCFEHLASRLLMALQVQQAPVRTVVVSGGVASNQYLRHILEVWLCSFGCPNVELNCPPPKYCTDNAAMVAWAGAEMFEAGWRTDLGFTARRKWALGHHARLTDVANRRGQGEEDAVGVLGVDCWYNVHDQRVTEGAETLLEPGPRPWSRPMT